VLEARYLPCDDLIDNIRIKIIEKNDPQKEDILYDEIVCCFYDSRYIKNILKI